MRYTDRVLQLVCVQTKPVQIYRITAGDALPPSGVPLDNGLDATVIVIDGGNTEDAAASGGGLPSSLSPMEVEAEAAAEVEAETAQAQGDDDAVEMEDAVVEDGRKDGLVGAAGDLDGVALSKEGDGGETAGAAGESAPSFEKVKREDTGREEVMKGERK